MTPCRSSLSLPQPTIAAHRSEFSCSTCCFLPHRQLFETSSSRSEPTLAQSSESSSGLPTFDGSLRTSCNKSIADSNSEVRIVRPLRKIWIANRINNDARDPGSRFWSSSSSIARASQGSKATAGLQDEEEATATENSAAGLTESVETAAPLPLPTMEDIVAAAAQDGVQLRVNSFGPTFEIVVCSTDGGTIFGKAEGFIRVWTQGKILHLESVKLERGLSKKVGNVFGAAFFVGAATLRYGLDRGCRTAQLMAIYDDEDTHNKLVKYYSRLGFKVSYEVGDEDWKHIPDRIMWGGVGTRMDADCEELVRRWASALRPKPTSSSST